MSGIVMLIVIFSIVYACWATIETGKTYDRINKRYDEVDKIYDKVDEIYGKKGK